MSTNSAASIRNSTREVQPNIKLLLAVAGGLGLVFFMAFRAWTYSPADARAAAAAGGAAGVSGVLTVTEFVTVTEAVTVTEVVTESVVVPHIETVAIPVTVTEAVPVYVDVPGPTEYVTVTVPQPVSVQPQAPAGQALVCIYGEGLTGIYLGPKVDGVEPLGLPGNSCQPVAWGGSVGEWVVTLTR